MVPWSSKISEKLYIDIFEKERNFDPLVTSRTIWIDKRPVELSKIKDFFNQVKECGIVLNIRERKGPKYGNKKNENKVVFIEFADPKSVEKALIISSKNEATIDSKSFNVKRAGTATFVYSKDFKKSVKSN